MAGSIPESHKAEIAEMISLKQASQAQSIQPRRDPANFLAYTEVTIRNRTAGKLTLINDNSYSGLPIGVFPTVIEVDRSQGFEHQAKMIEHPDGSIGFLVYSSKNYATGVDCGWLMAWSNPIGATNDTELKVYVETGLIAKYQPGGALHVDSVKQKLNASNNSSYFIDDASGAEASAVIQVIGETVEVAGVLSRISYVRL